MKPRQCQCGEVTGRACEREGVLLSAQYVPDSFRVPDLTPSARARVLRTIEITAHCAEELSRGLGGRWFEVDEPPFSPGPWSYTWGERGRYEVRDANGRTVAEVRNEADARLLASTPALFSLCRDAGAGLLDYEEEGGYHDRIRGEARTILARIRPR